jgi:hypothetical protein
VSPGFGGFYRPIPATARLASIARRRRGLNLRSDETIFRSRRSRRETKIGHHRPRSNNEVRSCGISVTFKSGVKTPGQLRVQREAVVMFYVEFFSQRRQTHLPESYAGRLAILRGVRGAQLFCERTTGKYLRSEKGG